jgi:hypothetical protein
MLKDFIHIFTLSCKQATYLIEKRIHVPLSVTERMRLAIHFSVCKLCQVYNKKAIFIDGWLKQRHTNGSCNCRFEEEEIKQFKEDVKEKIKV